MKRRLLTTRRSVPLDRTEEYDALWARVREVVVDAEGHAWRFRAAERQDVQMECIESRELDRILTLPEVQATRSLLDETFGSASTEEWEEATTP